MLRRAFLHPGQAAHEPGMAGRWRDTPQEDLIRRVGAAAGIDDLMVVADDADACSGTEVAQVAIHAVSLAALDALTLAGVVPDVVAGHSLGEVTAAVAAGVLDRHASGRVVGIRGRGFAAACDAQPGVMAAVLRMDDDELADTVADIDDLVVANHNAPGQVVVAGTQEAIQVLRDRVAGRRVRVLSLDVAGAFHSPAMESAVPPLVIALDGLPFPDPFVPLVSGVDAEPRHRGPDIRRALVDGVLRPVRWVDVQHRLATMADVFLEVGPGGVLAGCARRTVPDVPVLTVAGPEDVAGAVVRLAELQDAATTRSPQPAPGDVGARQQNADNNGPLRRRSPEPEGAS